MSVSKQKGTRFESDIVRFINGWAGEPVCERIVLHGNRDEGDIRLRVDDLTFTFEAKWRQRYPSDSDERDFREQTDREAANAGTDGGMLVINRYRKSISRSYVWMHAGTAFLLHYYAKKPPVVSEDDTWVCMHLGEFCELCFGPSQGKE